jgi:drug/metabolite transporter (DMT)-like permease
MQYMALNFISGSTYRILVGASIVTTLLFSKILLKIRIEKRQILGCGMGVLGLLLVGFSGLIESSQS